MSSQTGEPSSMQASQVLAAVDYVFRTGQVGDAIPEELRLDPQFQLLADKIISLSNFTIALANGNLNVDLPVKGRAAGGLKTLQASLRHLTWQTKQIASGDLTQRVAFMCDFAAAFNQMVEHLQESRALLENRAEELDRQKQIAVQLMQAAQAAREETEQANRKLLEQIDEITGLQAMLRDQAIHDPLTGCYNRRYLFETLEREFLAAGSNQNPISVILLDLDHFKLVNDTFGHTAGDEVLRMFGRILNKHARPSDLAARYGGEEFVLVQFDQKPLDAVRHADEIRRAASAECVPAAFPDLKVSLSAGVAAYPEHGLTFDSVIELADKALYAAKSFGRDRVICYR